MANPPLRDCIAALVLGLVFRALALGLLWSWWVTPYWGFILTPLQAVGVVLLTIVLKGYSDDGVTVTTDYLQNGVAGEAKQAILLVLAGGLLKLASVLIGTP